MKHFFPFLALSFAFLALTACEPKDEPKPQPEPIPESFPKKHLIEEFTGQSCGYCPYGMDCIHDFMTNDTNFILVLHHYGYSQDHFTIAGSKTITNALKVNGAPTMTINRAKTSYMEEGIKRSATTFHPGYLTSVDKSQFEQTTYASVNIQNKYDASSRELKVTVSGALCKQDYPLLNLTVMVKESGMIDTQADYYYSFEGWKEFRHTNAVRAILTNAKGDELLVDSTRHYKAEYTLTLKDAWVPENCMVVAFLSEEFQPVVQAAQKPVVEGTKGGADIRHGGITPVPVPDYYPEPDATSSPQDFSKRERDTLAVSYASSESYPSDGLVLWTIQAYNTSYSVSVGQTPCIPFVQLYLVMPYEDKPALPTGTFQINASEEPNTVIAGTRDDEEAQIYGSQFYFTDKSYFNQGYLNPMAQWLINSGSMTINKDGWTIDGTTFNGSEIHLSGAPLTIPKGAAPVRRMNKCILSGEPD